MEPSEEARLTEVRRIGKDRASEAAVTLQKAFEQDDFLSWLRGGSKKSDLAWWECLLKNIPAFGETHAIGDISAVSFWLPSEDLVKQFSQDASMKKDEAAPASVFDEEEIINTAFEYFGDRIEIFYKLHEMSPKEPHWYLASIGTLPEHHGKGRGTQLLKMMTEHLDNVGLPAYLEASNLKNSALYARHGFEVTQEIELMGAPTLYAMWRKPK